MQNYIEFVESLAQTGDDKVFFNSGPNHAAIVMSRIFKYSSDIVRIFSGGFTGTVSNDTEYLKYLHSFLENGGKVKVLVENDLSHTNAKIYSVFKEFQNSVEVYKTTARLIDTVSNKPIHFTVGDKKMLRIETGIKDFTAQVNFGSEKDASYFITLFDKVYGDTTNTKIYLA